MTDRPLESLTLRELFVDTERLTKELIEHLELGFLPKVSAISELARADGTSEAEFVSDLTLRTKAAGLLADEQFTNNLCEKLAAYSEAIEKGVNRIVRG